VIEPKAPYVFTRLNGSNARFIACPLDSMFVTG
jgi:hypothetical protein